MSDTGTFDLTPIFNGMLNGLEPDHAIWTLDPAAVLDTDEVEEFLADVLASEPVEDLTEEK